MKLFDWLNEDKSYNLPKYVVQFDILNIISCIAVVALHVNGAFWRFSYDRYWITSNLIEALFYFAVPVFVMLSGATLINYRERYSTQEFFKKRVLKTFVPFIIWSIIAIIYRIIKDGMTIFGGTFSVKKALGIIFFARANDHYWFFIVLFALYLSIPVVSAIEKSKRKKVFTYAVLVAILTYSILPLVSKLIDLPFNKAIQIPVVAGYVLYLLIGYCIAHYPLSKPMRITIYIFGLIGFALHLVGTYFLSYKAGAVDSTFKDYINIPCVMYSISVFVFIYYNKHLPKNPRLIGFVRAVSGASFGIYLIHKFIIETIVSIFSINITMWEWRFFGVFIVYIISLLIVLLIKKIPVLKNIVP